MERQVNQHMLTTHIPLLTRVIDVSAGDILEIGTGYHSTVLLNHLAWMLGRQVYSYENSRHWYKRAIRYESDFHHVVRCEDWDSADFDQRRWGVVLIDHAPDRRRPVEIRRLAHLADYLVIHDTPPEWDEFYGYSAIWPLFRYRYDYTKAFPWTTVVSNVYDLSKVA